MSTTDEQLDMREFQLMKKGEPHSVVDQRGVLLVREKANLCPKLSDQDNESALWGLYTPLSVCKHNRELSVK